MEAPAGDEPVEWILVTNRPVEGVAPMREVVWFYPRRPIIEEYHKALKSGCGVERLQLRTQGALSAAVGITAVLAVGSLELRDRARNPDRQDEPAAPVIGERAVVVLSTWRHGTANRNWTVREFVWALGRLGGHMNRPSDGTPGWQTLWRGLRKLRPVLDYDRQAQPDPVPSRIQPPTDRECSTTTPKTTPTCGTS